MQYAHKQSSPQMQTDMRLNPRRFVMKITMDMGSCEIERDESNPVEYGADTMNTDWNPADEPVCGLQEIAFTAEVTPAVVSAIVFRKMYPCRQ
jgi:hypothetical protein